MVAEPYRSTPIFTEETLPDGLRRAHALKAGVWGVLHLLAGRLRYVLAETDEEHVLEAGETVSILPEQPHFVEPMGAIEMRIDFYDAPPG